MDLKYILPGTIPGLLRRCSPVLIEFESEVVAGVIVGTDDRPEDKRVGPWLVYAFEGWPDAMYDAEVGPRSCSEDELALDLTDFTGRAHATRWLALAMQKDEERGSPRLELLSSMDRRKARLMCTMPEQVDPALLRRVCMHMAGIQEAV